MSILDKLDAVAETRKSILPPGVDPFNVVIDEIYSATEASIGGQRVLLAGSNNYLGLTFDRQCIEAAQARPFSTVAATRLSFQPDLSQISV